MNYGSFRGLQLNGIEILPGEHVGTLECDKTRGYSGTKFATPSAHGRFLAGHVYQASCRDNGNSASAVVEDPATALGSSGRRDRPRADAAQAGVQATLRVPPMLAPVRVAFG